ncbi:MAG: AI-2E family transporter [Chlorobi bacterium]|nr:AI-2E family transporter [Chlorobiota bacterium]
MTLPGSVHAERKEKVRGSRSVSFLGILASLVIILAGLKVAAPIIVPFLLAVFIFIIFRPFATALRRKGVPNWLALTLVILLILFFTMLMATLLTLSVQNFSQKIPYYTERLTVYQQDILRISEKYSIPVKNELLDSFFDPGKVMKFAAGALKNLSDLLSNGFMILFTVILIFIESSAFAYKIRIIIKDKERLENFKQIDDKLNRYMMIKTIVSLITGGLITAALAIMGVDFPVLWGLVAFLLNFIPSIGSLIAAIPPILLSLVQLGIPASIFVAIIFISVNILLGSIIEPRIMGKGLGLSVLVVFISLVFWGWILGPVGMFLSIPLTIVVKIFLESQPETRWIGVLLGGTPHRKTNVSNS